MMLTQCVAIVGGTAYDFSARSFTNFSFGAGSTNSVRLSVFSSNDCSGAALDTVATNSTSFPSWALRTRLAYVPPGNARSARIELTSTAGPVSARNDILWDNVIIDGQPGAEGEAIARATFEVSKDFTDDNPAGVEVTISCNTGLPLEQSKVITEGEGVGFVVIEFDSGELDCEITEDVPAGYDAVYFDGTSNSSTSCEYLNVGAGAAFACRTTNTPGPVEVEITKDWVFEGSSDPQGIDQRYELTLWCDTEIVDGEFLGDQQEAPSGIIGPFCGQIVLEGIQGSFFADWCKVFFGEGPDSFTAEVIPEFPDSHCFVIERLFDDAVEVDNGCQNITVSAGVGASCTITNTVFFEGIPTLNRYGLALLALLMLGVGFVGFRRLV
jgi:hypothetical protein